MRFGLRHRRALHHLDPGRGADRGEILGGVLDFIVRHRFGKAAHQIGVGFSWIGRFAGVVAEVHHLLHEIFVSQAGDVGVLRTTLAIRVVT